jgi:hypothetical protein
VRAIILPRIILWRMQLFRMYCRQSGSYPETGFEEIDVRTALRIARISSKRTSGPE